MNTPISVPDNYPHEWIEPIQLHCGTQTLLRPIRPDDAPRLQAGQPRLIGVARYALLNADDPQVAESAVVVVDEYQQCGLGTIMMDRLIRFAVTRGVECFLATVHHTNLPIQRLIERSGLDASRQMLEPGVWEIKIFLTRSGASKIEN
jgi:RimJ/RimL family protein N-acetyltransferase